MRKSDCFRRSLFILLHSYFVDFRHVITPRSVRCAIALAYFVPSTVFLVMFCTVPGGFRAPIPFAFFSKDGCNGGGILRGFSS
ncbi:hypothetical protein ANCDUO_02268 [Ancylostoma duodenale]|uniref:Uncharacterized protein n=1 Tax=Ancylostoma duodenale TaxID=51022 RepID=A0A0C2HCY5_9BILA|nr:hypothetical protein ANCDUO_02268 [Ancylostoma duodenale]